MKMRKYSIDLHIHSVLSPCADLLMTPGNIIKKAEEIGLDIIAITDHNSAANLSSAMKIAESKNIIIIPAMELETAEEIHLLTFFPNLDKAMDMQKIVYKNLVDMKNDEEYFGYQIITDENDEYIAKEKRLLSTALNLSLEEVVKKVREMGGFVIPSHINRSFGIINNLAFIPDHLDLSILEIYKNENINEIVKEIPYLKNYKLIKNSDSHYLDDISIMMEMELENYDFDNFFKKMKFGKFIVK